MGSSRYATKLVEKTRRLLRNKDVFHRTHTPGEVGSEPSYEIKVENELLRGAGTDDLDELNISGAFPSLTDAGLEAEYDPQPPRDLSGTALKMLGGLKIERGFRDLVETYKSLRTPRVLGLLEQLREQRDPKTFSATIQDIVDLLTITREHRAFRDWLNESAYRWITERRLGLAAVVEVLGRFPVEGADRLLAKVLDSSSDDLTASVAAQRIRALTHINASLREQTWTALRRRIDGWLSSSLEGTALLAIPSVPTVAGPDGPAWLSERIEGATHQIAWAATLAALDWATGTASMAPRLGEADLAVLADAVLARVKRERARAPSPGSGFDLVSALVWSLGAVVDVSRLAEAASTLTDCFVDARGLEDAAAVRAGTLMAERLGAPAIAELTKAFAKYGTDSFYRYVSLLAARAPSIRR